MHEGVGIMHLVSCKEICVLASMERKNIIISLGKEYM